MNIPFTVRDLADKVPKLEERLEALEAHMASGAEAHEREPGAPGVNIEEMFRRLGLAELRARLDATDTAIAAATAEPGLAELRARLDRVEQELREEPWNQGDPNPLSGVDFASDQAAELAASADLSVDDFTGAHPSGANSAFNVSDVRGIIASLNNAGA